MQLSEAARRHAQELHLEFINSFLIAAPLEKLKDLHPRLMPVLNYFSREQFSLCHELIALAGIEPGYPDAPHATLGPFPGAQDNPLRAVQADLTRLLNLVAQFLPTATTADADSGYVVWLIKAQRVLQLQSKQIPALRRSIELYEESTVPTTLRSIRSRSYVVGLFAFDIRETYYFADIRDASFGSSIVVDCPNELGARQAYWDLPDALGDTPEEDIRGPRWGHGTPFGHTTRLPCEFGNADRLNRVLGETLRLLLSRQKAVLTPFAGDDFYCEVQYFSTGLGFLKVYVPIRPGHVPSEEELTAWRRGIARSLRQWAPIRETLAKAAGAYRSLLESHGARRFDDVGRRSRNGSSPLPDVHVEGAYVACFLFEREFNDPGSFGRRRMFVRGIRDTDGIKHVRNDRGPDFSVQFGWALTSVWVTEPAPDVKFEMDGSDVAVAVESDLLMVNTAWFGCGIIDNTISETIEHALRELGRKRRRHDTTLTRLRNMQLVFSEAVDSFRPVRWTWKDTHLELRQWFLDRWKVDERWKSIKDRIAWLAQHQHQREEYQRTKLTNSLQPLLFVLAGLSLFNALSNALEFDKADVKPLQGGLILAIIACLLVLICWSLIKRSRRG